MAKSRKKQEQKPPQFIMMNNANIVPLRTIKSEENKPKLDVKTLLDDVTF